MLNVYLKELISLLNYFVVSVFFFRASIGMSDAIFTFELIMHCSFQGYQIIQLDILPFRCRFSTLL